MTGYKVPKSLIEEKRCSTTADLIEAIEALGGEELDGWQTGVPNKIDVYLVCLREKGFSNYTYTTGVTFGDDCFSFCGISDPSKYDFIAYQKITPYKEG